MTIMPIMSVNSYPAKTNVIPSAGSKRLNTVNQVNFRGHGGGHEENENNHWFLKLLLVCVAGYAGYRIFRNPIRNAFNKVVGHGTFKELLKKAETKETLTLKDVETYMKSLAKDNKDSKRGFILKLDEAQRKQCGITSKEAFAFGYFNKDGDVIASKAIVCDKFDDALSKKFDGKNYIPFS